MILITTLLEQQSRRIERWRFTSLVPLGQLVYRKIRRMFPETPVYHPCGTVLQLVFDLL